MSCCGTIGTFCGFIVAAQLFCGVFRWIYENILGPKFGTPIDLKSYGKWARKYFRSVAKLQCLSQFVISGKKRHENL
jgi:hypothetical protein